MHRIITILRGTCVALAAACAPAAAEGGHDPEPFIGECAQAARAARGPADAPATYAALNELAESCDELPLPRLDRLWARVPADSTMLSRLSDVTGSRGEGLALFDALVRVAADPARPPLVRAHALSNLEAYFHPGSSGALEAFQDTLSPAFASFTHAGYAASSSILPADKDRARGVLHRAGARAADRRLWHAFDTFLGSTRRGIDRWDGPAAEECAARVESAGADALALFPDARAAYAVRGCTGAGPALFARAWAAVIADSTALQALMAASQAIRDGRTLDAVLQAARDPARPLAVRFAALHTAAALADPALHAVGPETWKRDPETCYGWWGWHHHHAVQEDGAVPLPLGRQGIRGRLEQIAAAADHPDVGRLSALLARCIRPDA